jgi:hypothetical protein
MVLTLGENGAFSTADCSQRSLKIGRKNLWKSLNIFGLGDYEPCYNYCHTCYVYRNLNKFLVGMI